MNKQLHWDNVFELLDTIGDRYNPKFMARGTVLLENWGTTFIQVVEMMYWADMLGGTQRKDNTGTIKFLARELSTTADFIESLLESTDALAGKE